MNLLSELVSLIGDIALGAAPSGVGKTERRKKKEHVLVIAILGFIAACLVGALVYSSF
jgi:hypothetical protein